MQHRKVMKVLVAQSCPTSCDPWTIACQAPPSMGFSRQNYWSGLPCAPPGDLPNPGIEPQDLLCLLLWQVGSLPLVPPGKLLRGIKYIQNIVWPYPPSISRRPSFSPNETLYSWNNRSSSSSPFGPSTVCARTPTALGTSSYSICPFV